MECLWEKRATKNSPSFIMSDIEFADDCVLFAESENDLQQMVNHIHVKATAAQEHHTGQNLKVYTKK